MPLKKSKKHKHDDASSTSTDSEPWRETQARAFTNWLNDKLKDAGIRVNHLAKDLADGLALIALLEKLSGKKVPGK